MRCVPEYGVQNMIKRILLPLDSSEYSGAATRFACFLATHHDAEVTGMVILDIHGIEKSIGAAPPGGMYYAGKLEKQKEEEAKSHIREMLDAFAETCRQAGVRYTESERQGSPSERIADESNYYDLIVMGAHTHYNFQERGKRNPLFDVLDKCTAPIYAVPRSFSVDSLPDERIKAAVVIDGSPASARAVQRFAQLAMSSRIVATIIAAHHERALAEFALAETAHYLRSHGIHVAETVTGGSPRQIVETYSQTHDVFVVGEHHKSGLMKLFGGDLTKLLVENDSKPVLISH